MHLIIGVEASQHIEKGNKVFDYHVTTKHTYLLRDGEEAVPLYDGNGEPIIRKESVDYIRLNWKNYGRYSGDKGKTLRSGAFLEDMSFEEFLGSAGLVMVGRSSDDGVIGVKIKSGNREPQPVPFHEINAAFMKAKSALALVGINEEPRLYIRYD